METSSADSSQQSTILLGDLLSIPLKHPYTPSLTAESPLHGQPRLFSDEDYIVPPDLNCEAIYSSAKSSCPKVICYSELVDPLTLSPSDLSSPLKPVRDVVLCASYSPGRPTGLSASSSSDAPQSCFVKFALLHPSFYHLVSPDILSTIEDLDLKRLFYGPVASLIFICKRDELVNDFGFPVPEIEAELRGVSDVSLLKGVLSWGGDSTSTMSDIVSGPLTRSKVSVLRPSSSTSVKATASLSRG